MINNNNFEKVADREVITLPNDSKSLKCPTGDICTIGNVEEFPALSNRISDAALWYAGYERDHSQLVIRLVRERFGLTTLQAIEALKLGHKLKYQGAANV